MNINSARRLRCVPGICTKGPLDNPCGKEPLWVVSVELLDGRVFENLSRCIEHFHMGEWNPYEPVNVQIERYDLFVFHTQN